MSNQEVLIAIQRGYRMEKPNYPGKTSPENMNAIYTVSTIGKNIMLIYYRNFFTVPRIANMFHNTFSCYLL